MFKKKYFSILFWKFFVYGMGMLSMLIVTPKLSNDPKLFGIYTFCASIVIFFSYADLGFINAARKYAAEYLQKKQLKKEIAVTAFSCFIFLVFALPLSMILIYLSQHPGVIVRDLGNGQEYEIASHLLLILSLSFPIIILQRVMQIIYAIRLEDYIVYRTEIVLSVLRIIAVYILFREDQYPIVVYFLFSNLLNLFSLAALGITARYRYSYNFVLFVKFLRYRKAIYKNVSKLAFNSLFVSLAWLLFYEIDVVLITMIAGAGATAYYAVAFNLTNVLRNLLGTIYYPFTVRFNQLEVTNKDELKSFFYQILRLGSFLVLPGLAVICAFSRGFVLTWVGNNYFPSIIILQFLVFSYFFYVINTPVSAILVAKVETKLLYWYSLIVVVTQYTILCIGYNFMDASILLSLLKPISTFLGSLLFCKWMLSYLKISLFNFVQHVLWKPFTMAILIIAILLPIITSIDFHKSAINFLILSIAACLVYLIGMVILFFIDREFKTAILMALNFKKG